MMPAQDQDSLVERLRRLRAARGISDGDGRRGLTRNSLAKAEKQSPDHTLIDPSARAAVLSLDRARHARVRPAHDFSLAVEVDTQARLIRSVQKGLTRASVAWDRVLGGCGLSVELLSNVQVKSYRRGILTIRVRDSATKYLLARFLRSGGEASLARLAPVVVTRVKLVMG